MPCDPSSNEDGLKTLSVCDHLDAHFFYDEMMAPNSSLSAKISLFSFKFLEDQNKYVLKDNSEDLFDPYLTLKNKKLSFLGDQCQKASHICNADLRTVDKCFFYTLP